VRRLNTLRSFSRCFFASLLVCCCKRILPLPALKFNYFGGAEPG
jgi:hypothetical protein